MRRRLVCAAAGALVAVAATSCSSSSHSSTGSGRRGSTTASTEIPTGTPGFVLIANRSSVVSSGAPAHLSASLTKGLEGIVRDYVVRATVDVLHTGRLGKGFSNLFGPDAVAALGHAGNDRLTVTDLGYARGSGAIRVRVVMHLTALGDQGGRVVMASASFKAAVRRGDVAIDRSGELLLAPGGGGRWQIIGYNLRARRAVGAAPATTTTAKAATSGATP